MEDPIILCQRCKGPDGKAFRWQILCDLCIADEFDELFDE